MKVRAKYFWKAQIKPSLIPGEQCFILKVCEFFSLNYQPKPEAGFTIKSGWKLFNCLPSEAREGSRALMKRNLVLSTPATLSILCLLKDAQSLSG